MVGPESISGMPYLRIIQLDHNAIHCIHGEVRPSHSFKTTILEKLDYDRYESFGGFQPIISVIVTGLAFDRPKKMFNQYNIIKTRTSLF
jgi:hypothetical protein